MNIERFINGKPVTKEQLKKISIAAAEVRRAIASVNSRIDVTKRGQ